MTRRDAGVRSGHSASTRRHTCCSARGPGTAPGGGRKLVSGHPGRWEAGGAGCGRRRAARCDLCPLCNAGNMRAAGGQPGSLPWCEMVARDAVGTAAHLFSGSGREDAAVPQGSTAVWDFPRQMCAVEVRRSASGRSRADVALAEAAGVPVHGWLGQGQGALQGSRGEHAHHGGDMLGGEVG